MATKAALSLRDFVDFSELSYALPEDAFALLGEALKAWLAQTLKNKKVQNTPVILGRVHPQAYLEGAVFVDEGAEIEPFAFVKGPTYIGRASSVRHGAYVRGEVFVGNHCVVGHTTEVKGSVFLDHAKAAHFAYVGDSILGRHVNLGAGTKLANLKLRADEVFFKDPHTKLRCGSGLKKFGAILGDHAQTGCNAVLSPGTLLFPNTAVYPCSHFQGTLTQGFAR